MKRYLIFISLILSIALDSSYATRRKAAQAGMQFLKIGVGARAAAMGEAYLAVADNLDAMYWNPGGLALCPSSGVQFSVTEWIANIKQLYVAGGIDLGNLGYFGFDLTYMDYPNLVATRVPQAGEFAPLGYIPMGKLEINEFAAGIAYSRRITNKLSLGGHVKLVWQDLWKSVTAIRDSAAVTKDNLVHELGYDLGTIYYTGFKSLRFGMTVQNFSRDIKFNDDSFPMPLTFKMGIAMDMMDFWPGLHDHHQLTLAIDVLHPRDNYERVNAGLEYWFMNTLALRAGYKFNYDEESFTAGVGFKIHVGTLNGVIDYSYSDFGPYFGNVKRFSMGLFF